MAFESRDLKHPRGRKKGGGGWFPFLIVILGITFFLLYFWVRGVGDLIVKPGDYSLEKGVTISDVPEQFGLEVSPLQYKLWLRFFAPEVKNLQAGTYEIEISSELSSIFEKTLSRPSYSDLTITILPGWNMYDIDDYLSSKKIIRAGTFLIAARENFPEFQKKYPFLEGKMSLEGFLFPDTYRILVTADSYMIIDRLLSEWQKKIAPTYMALGDDAYEELILASIVEREERIPEEKSTIADILSKRVREGIPMGADATVCYGYAKTQKQCTPAFIGSVIGDKHPYNTRNKQGYPPTPISSISLGTWEATLAKKPSPYYYYLHDQSGNIHYGKTLEEHNTNKRNYIK